MITSLTFAIMHPFSTHLRIQLRAELKLGDGALPLPGDDLMSPPLHRVQLDLSPDDYRSPSPVQR